MTISPVLLALCGLLLSALGAITAGGVAWGRFANALDRLREDHRETRDEVKRLVDTVTKHAVTQSRASKHSQASDLATLRLYVDGVLVQSGSYSGSIDWGDADALWHISSHDTDAEKFTGVVLRAGVENVVWSAAEFAKRAQLIFGTWGAE